MEIVCMGIVCMGIVCMGIVCLVPQGAEYQSVQRGLGDRSDVQVIAIPAGLQPVRSWLAARSDDPPWQSAQHIIVMGLCGALDPALKIGDRVSYTTCQNLENQIWQCAPSSSFNAKPVKAINTNTVIATQVEKQALRSRSGCDVVDMEGTAVLEFFQNSHIPVTMLRVVSDDAHSDIPDLSAAIDPNGKLQSSQLAIAMLKAPLKGLRLIRGATIGLRRLEKFATEI
jgi:hypothetical protein